TPLDRPDRDPEAGGDPGERLVAEVMEDEQGASVGAQVVERPRDRVDPVDRLGPGLARTGAVEAGRDRDLADPPLAAELHPAAVDQDPTQPRVELVEIAQSGQVLPGGDAGVLGRVTGVGLVADDRPRGPEQRVDAWRDQRLEGVAVA